MIAIIDYGMGNLRSVQKALQFVGQDAVITSYLDEINKADKIVLPGVGAIGDAMETIRKKGFDKAIYKACDEGKPFLGICLGMQILASLSEEGKDIPLLGLVDGTIDKLDTAGLPLPHMGWNQVLAKPGHPLFRSLDDNAWFYFVHSYALALNESTIAETEYGSRFSSAIQKDNFYGVQFHPERSGKAGAQLIKNFLEM